ncbi:hypothetical protein FJT64_014710 [Amphibalanus amphitrite]|uniref:Uncharacterized protein n=1 Tax=Amphibalanus amphitrite TaxID=1232801 RepID=A0A6A4V8Y3_AMPAM|nr:hypothetical protein FJT64_014710 [Amphibalanus amphitrite]
MVLPYQSPLPSSISCSPPLCTAARTCVMEDPDSMIGPVAEALGVTRTWLLSSDDPMPERMDLPVGLMVELMDAADALYPTEEQRWRQLRGWLSRLTGRPQAEFERAAPLMEAVRRQFALSRDEDLQAVTVWRRVQPTPAELSKLQLTVRPENGARLRRLVQQLGSEEAAIEFLLQMDDNCGKGASLRRTRWPPKVHYESSRGQVKIDVGTEMVCVVLSQFKPAPAPDPAPEPEPETALPPPPHSAVEVVPATPSVLTVNGHAASSDEHSAGGAAPPLPLGSSSAYQTVVRDATLPAQMFADDDLAADQFSEVQSQLTSVLDQLGEDSNQMSDVPPAPGSAVPADLMAGEEKQETVIAQETTVSEEIPSLDDSSASLGAEAVMLEGEEVSLEGQEVALDSEEVIEGQDVTLEGEEVALEGEEVALEGEEVPLEGEVVLDQEVALDGEEVALDAAEGALDSEELSADTAGPLEDTTTTSSDQVSLQADTDLGEGPSSAEQLTVVTEITEVTEVSEQITEQVAEPTVELPEQLMEAEEPAVEKHIAIDAEQLPDAVAADGDAAQADEPMVEPPDEPMEVGGEGGEAPKEPPAV